MQRRDRGAGSRGGTRTASVGALAATVDPGDELAVRVVATDPDGVSGEPLDASVTLVSHVAVAPVYPANADWNAYVKNDDASVDRFHQDDVACAAATDAGSGGPERCLHGGESRVVVVPGLRDCAAYAITDALGAWSWTCQDHAGARRQRTAASCASRARPCGARPPGST